MLDKKIIVFDGVCILCNSFVQFILKRDRSKQFYFTTAQSDFVQDQVKTMQLKVNPMDSVIYLKNGKVLSIDSKCHVSFLRKKTLSRIRNVGNMHDAKS